MYFDIKNYLKNIYNHPAKHAPKLVEEDAEGIVDDTIPPTMLFFFYIHTYIHTYIYLILISSKIY
jgi:hypothetical protein